jgi:t-SNARE complex subunit (syntaxin)
MNQKQKQQSNKQARDRLMGEQPQKKDRFSKLDDSINQDNQSYIDNQLLLQNKTIEQQDRGLDQASQGIERVQHIAIAMGDELSDQNRELEEMERDVERTQGMMKRTMNRLNKLLNQTSDKGKIIMIIILVVIIIGLVAVILAV